MAPTPSQAACHSTAPPMVARLSGTSMSSPAAAGVVALMLEANPELTPGDIRTILEWTAREDDDTGDLPAEGEHVWGHGKVTATRAVTASIDWVSGLSELLAEKSPISVHPNPAQHEVWVTTQDPQPGRWTLFNVQGQVVRSGALTPWFNIARWACRRHVHAAGGNGRLPRLQRCLSSSSTDAWSPMTNLRTQPLGKNRAI